MGLRIEHITAGYGDTIVLRDIDLTVPDASTVALLGPNGAGKTTLLRVVVGLLAPKSGKITFQGHDIGGWQPSRRAVEGICLIPEGRGVFPSLTVRDNLVLQAAKGDEG